MNTHKFLMPMVTAAMIVFKLLMATAISIAIGLALRLAFPGLIPGVGYLASFLAGYIGGLAVCFLADLLDDVRDGEVTRGS